MFDIYGGLRMTAKPSVFRKMDCIIAHKGYKKRCAQNQETTDLAKKVLR